MITLTVDEESQITLPHGVLEHLGVQPGGEIR